MRIFFLFKNFSRNIHEKGSLLDVDSLEWDFIRWMLSNVGFLPRFVDWIMECISSLLIASLSMAIFMETLKESEIFVKVVLYHQTFLSYAWTTFLEWWTKWILLNSAFILLAINKNYALGLCEWPHAIFRGDIGSIRIIMDILLGFKRIIGLAHSPHKLAIYMVGISDLEGQNILEEMEFQIGTFPFRYLGVPLLSFHFWTLDKAAFLEKDALCPLCGLDNESTHTCSFNASFLTRCGSKYVIPLI